VTVFGKDATALGIQPDDLGLRYLLWMTLGGTQRDIPVEALIAVGNSQIAGSRRAPNVDESANLASANMLNTARALCRSVLPMNHAIASNGEYKLTTGPVVPNPTPNPLIETNGDSAMWQRLCSWGHLSPVQVIQFNQDQGKFFINTYPWPSPADPSSFDYEYKLYDPDLYGAQPVMTKRGLVNGVGPDDQTAWCIDPASTSAAVDQMRNDNKVGGNAVPYCPAPPAPKTWADVLWDHDKQEQWAIRAAMNAGEAVFVYLDAIARGTIKPKLQYNECSKL
jgi:hypothetical protein